MAKKWDGIYLGRRKGKELIYAGKADHGFDAASAKDLQARLKPLIRTPRSLWGDIDTGPCRPPDLSVHGDLNN